MKLTNQQVEGFFKNPSTQKAVLFYGPDAGQVRENAKKTLLALGKKPDDNFAVTWLEAASIKENPSLIFENMSAMSLMGDNPVVAIRDAEDFLTPHLKEAFAHPSCQNYLIVCGGELASKSSLRYLFEKENFLAAAACYRDEGRSLEQVIKNGLEKRGIKYDRNCFAYLVENLGNDRAITENEINKIDIYLGQERNLTLEIAEILIASNNDRSMDDLLTAIMQGNISHVNILSERLFREGTSPISIIRAVGRYYERLLQAFSLQSQNIPIDEIMDRKLKPPVFYKYKPIFRATLANHNLEKIIRVISSLTRTERDMKRISDQNLACINSLTLLTASNRRK